MKLPLIETIRAADNSSVQRDVMAGLTTAIMLVPQAMAYAMLAGLEPIVGLYASTIPLALYALLGTSRQLAVGPVAMISLLVASGVAPIAGADPVRFAALAALLALMVGVIQLSMGLLRVGFLVKFLSHPVIAGFTSAAALIIGLSQLKHMLGVPLPRSHHVHEIVLSAIEHAADVHWATVAIALTAVTLLVGLKHWAPAVPRFLVVVVGGALLVWGAGLDHAGVAIVGSVPSGLPPIRPPALELESMRALLPIAVAISLVAFMESISVAKAFAKADGYEVDANQELIALGTANIGAACIGGYPITGGFSRTAVNAQAGAKSGIAALITSGVVVLTLLFLTPLFFFLPKAVLAAIIMTAVFGLIDVEQARHLWTVSRPDAVMMALTFVATLALGIEPGIGIGVASSLLWFVWRQSSPHVARLGRVPGTNVFRNIERNPEVQPPLNVLAVRIDGPLFFANTAFLKAKLTELEDGNLFQAIVLDAEAIGDIDASGEAWLAQLVRSTQSRGIDFWIAGLHGPVRDVLNRSGLMTTIGHNRVVYRIHEVVDIYEPSRLAKDVA